jgi:hypothetical protein
MEKEQFPFRVKPKHQVHVRGIEYNEGQAVTMTNEEFNILAAEHPECHSRLVPAAEFEPFMAQYNAGHIDHTGQPIIPTAPEAQGQPEAGALPPIEETDHVQ